MSNNELVRLLDKSNAEVQKKMMNYTQFKDFERLTKQCEGFATQELVRQLSRSFEMMKQKSGENFCTKAEVQKVDKYLKDWIKKTYPSKEDVKEALKRQSKELDESIVEARRIAT